MKYIEVQNPLILTFYSLPKGDPSGHLFGFCWRKNHGYVHLLATSKMKQPPLSKKFQQQGSHLHPRSSYFSIFSYGTKTKLQTIILLQFPMLTFSPLRPIGVGRWSFPLGIQHGTAHVPFRRTLASSWFTPAHGFPCGNHVDLLTMTRHFFLLTTYTNEKIGFQKFADFFSTTEADRLWNTTVDEEKKTWPKAPREGSMCFEPRLF